jgi:hypothetical protein
MKRKGTAPGGSVEEYVVPEWSTDEDRPVKRHGIEDRVFNGDTNSDISKSLGDEVCTPWLLYSAAILEEDEAQTSGALIRGNDGTQSSSALFREEDITQSGSV